METTKGTKKDFILSALGINVEGKELSAEEIGALFKNFKEIKKTIEDYEKTVLKPYFFSGAENFGHVTESGGHKVLLTDGSGWEKQARVSVAVDQEKALALLKSKWLDYCIDREEFIDEANMGQAVSVLRTSDNANLISIKESVTDSTLEQLFLDEKIEDDELAQLITRNVTYALVEVKPPKKK